VADSIFENNPALSFKRTEIEESKGIKRKRPICASMGKQQADSRRRSKFAGTADGRNAYNFALVNDSAHKHPTPGRNSSSLGTSTNSFCSTPRNASGPSWNADQGLLTLALTRQSRRRFPRKSKANSRNFCRFFAELQAIMDGKAAGLGNALTNSSSVLLKAISLGR